VIANAAGRFTFDDVPRGLAQLLVHPAADDAGLRLVTPAFSL
jgi:hypothetical protein